MGGGEEMDFKEALKKNEHLKVWKKLADRRERGFKWFGQKPT